MSEKMYGFDQRRDVQDEDELEGFQAGIASPDLTTCLPDMRKLEGKNQREAVKKLYWYLGLLYGAATISFIVIICVIPALQAKRYLPINIDSIQPTVNATTWDELFNHVTNENISHYPPTVIITVWAGVMFVYYGYIIWRGCIKSILLTQCNPWRWVSYAISKTLYASLLFAYNGATQLDFFLVLGTAIGGTCFVAHKLEVSVCYYHQMKGKTENTETSSGMGGMGWILDESRTLMTLIVILFTGFIVRLAWNQQNTPTWVLGLSVAYLIMDFIAALIYIQSVYSTKCNEKLAQTDYAQHEWNFNVYNFILFVPFTVTAIVSQSKI